MDSSYITFGGMLINYIVDEVKIQTSQSFNTSPYVGADGSSTTFVSREGKNLSFKSLCLKREKSEHNRGHRINDYIYISKTYSKKAGVLVSSSESKIDGNYFCVKMDYTEDTEGNYEIEWEFQENVKFNVVNKTFKVWGKNKKTTTSKKKKTVTKKSNTVSLNSNIKFLLKSCGTMKANNTKGIRCVKALQTFLQSQGFYKGYKLDGWFSTYTKKAVKNIQKKYKLKTTGEWDKNTRAYFQKKYKYPTKKKPKK